MTGSLGPKTNISGGSVKTIKHPMRQKVKLQSVTISLLLLSSTDALGKTKVTGIEQVDTLQDGVNNTAASQLGKGGLLQPIGDMASKEGVNRAERGGKDEKGNSAAGPMSKVANPVAENAKTGGNAIMDGAKGAGGYVSGLWGGKQGEK
jgi:hypothetical protein